MTTTKTYQHLGKNRKIIDGREKITGHARYTADLKLPRMCHIRPILSPYAHALITHIDKKEALALEGVIAILTADDLPTRNRTMTSRNSAILAQGRVQWVGQPVVAIVAETEAIAADAADLVLIDYDPLPAIISLEEAIQHGRTQVWPNGMPKEGDDMSSLHAKVETGTTTTTTDKPNNMIGEAHFTRGNLDTGFAEAETIIQRTYRTSIVHQLYLEPHAVTVEPNPLGDGATIYTSTQGQYGVRTEVAHLLNLPESNIIVKPMKVGGAFGAKYGIYEPLATAVALTIRQPVRLCLTRSEDLLSSTPAPQTLIHLKTGAKKDGTVTALQATIYADNGLFGFSHGGIMSLLMGGYYKWPHLKIDAYEIATHKPPVGAYRAPGAPQATFAIESNIDDMAHQLNLDPLKFRLQNVATNGDLMGVGRPWPGTIGLRQCLERLQTHPLWQNRASLADGESLGLAIGGWPTAVGNAETTCRIDTSGKARLNIGTVDISGTHSSLALIVAEAIGISPDDVIIIQDDTEGAYGPNSGGSMATYSVATAVHQASQTIRQKLQTIAAQQLEAAPEDIDITNGHAQVRGAPHTRTPIGQLVAKARQKQGPLLAEATAALPENAPAFVAHLIKIKLDPHTGTITPLNYITVQDVGFALNPLLVEGQLHGGAVQGIGFALHEAMVFNENGQLLSGSLMDYGIPRIDDVPHIEVIQIENPSPHGAFGMRGIAEPPITAAPAAIANAIKNATGHRLTQLPLRSELIWQALQNN